MFSSSSSSTVEIGMSRKSSDRVALALVLWCTAASSAAAGSAFAAESPDRIPGLMYGIDFAAESPDRIPGLMYGIDFAAESPGRIPVLMYSCRLLASFFGRVLSPFLHFVQADIKCPCSHVP
jgi:hypothetical protein